MSSRSLGEKLRSMFSTLLRRRGAEDAHAAFVKQPIGQPLARERRIDQLDVVDGGDQGTAFDPGIVLGQNVRLCAGRRVAGIEIGLARSFGRFRQELCQNSAGAPVPARAARASAEL